MEPSKRDHSFTIRLGTQADTHAVFRVFYQSLSDLFLRLGQATPEQIEEPGRQEKWWEEWKPLFEHLAQTADQFWVAEREGQAVGFARSILRDGVRELTEFFPKLVVLYKSNAWPLSICQQTWV